MDLCNSEHCVGLDSGACGYGLQEAQVALNIGYLVEKYLRDVGYDVKVFQADDLVETAFIDNPADNQDDFARAIACGITDYVGGL